MAPFCLVVFFRVGVGSERGCGREEEQGKSDECGFHVLPE